MDDGSGGGDVGGGGVGVKVAVAAERILEGSGVWSGGREGGAVALGRTIVLRLIDAPSGEGRGMGAAGSAAARSKSP